MTLSERRLGLLALITTLENAARWHAVLANTSLGKVDQNQNMARKDANIARKRVREYLRDWCEEMELKADAPPRITVDMPPSWSATEDTEPRKPNALF